MKKRLLSTMLAVCMLLSMLPTTVFAAVDPATNLCEHHMAHDDTCGYVEGTPGSPCTHTEHTVDCYTGAACNHTHDENCGGLSDETACTHTEHTVDCYTGAACNHTHDAAVCGYIEAIPGAACGYVCPDCAGEPVPVSETGDPADGTTDPATCDCSTKCTADTKSESCPVCSVEDAVLDDVCTGQEPQDDPAQDENDDSEFRIEADGLTGVISGEGEITTYTVTKGTTLTLRVVQYKGDTLTNLTYQWQTLSNNQDTDVTDATSSTFDPTTDTIGTTVYRCVVGKTADAEYAYYVPQVSVTVVEGRTVSFAANGGTGKMDNVIGVSGDYTLPDSGFTAPAGKAFSAWAENSPSGTQYAVGSTYTVSADTTFYAVWRDVPPTPSYDDDDDTITYLIQYHANGGDGTMGSRSVEEGDTHTLLENKFTAPADKVFLGWDTNRRAVFPAYQPGDKYTVTGPVTFYAIWGNTNHFHAICGAECGHDEAHEIVSFEEYEGENTLSGGCYYLAEDVSRGDSVSIEGDVTLCLNGHRLANNGVSSVIVVQRGGSLTLCDCAGGGVITGGKDEYGGGVHNFINGTFTMYGGEISGNTADYGGGGGVRNSGTFTMYGGEISGNTADGGGGVHNASSFTMYGGEISGNTANGGGGVLNNGSFTMYGGDIAHNTSGTSGGGVYNENTFTMCGGFINFNVASSGGGIYVWNNAICTLSGNAEVLNNGTGNERNNIHLHASARLTLDELTGEDGAFGISMDSPGVFTTGGKSEYARFTSDNKDYFVAIEGQDLSLLPSDTPHHKITFDAGDGAINGERYAYVWTYSTRDFMGEYEMLRESDFPVPDEREGWRFVYWVNPAGRPVTDTWDYTEDTTLTAVWKEEGSGVTLAGLPSQLGGGTGGTATFYPASGRADNVELIATRYTVTENDAAEAVKTIVGSSGDVTAKGDGSFTVGTDQGTKAAQVVWAGDVSLVKKGGTAAKGIGGTFTLTLPTMSFPNANLYLIHQTGEGSWDVGPVYGAGDILRGAVDIDSFSPFILLAVSDYEPDPEEGNPGTDRDNPDTGATPPEAVLPDKKYLTYIVKWGDTLWALSRKYGCTVADIVALNGELIKDPDLILVGWELKIPQA